MHSLIVGILTALPSGAAVAIAILGENVGSLVGVAISASILPPAVNTVSNFESFSDIQYHFELQFLKTVLGNFLVDGRFAFFRCGRSSNNDQIELLFGPSND